MNAQPNHKSMANELAKERSRQASDRTLMAWVRTSLSLIGFGLCIASFRDILLEAGLIRNPHKEFNGALVFGLSFISLGVLGLLAAVIQHRRILQHLKQDNFSCVGFRCCLHHGDCADADWIVCLYRGTNIQISFYID